MRLALAFLLLALLPVDAMATPQDQYGYFQQAMKDMRGKPLRYHSANIKDFERKLAKVNDEVNATYNVDDQLVYGDRNHWATPREFYLFGGMCRDYAVAKYYRLYALGVADADMEIAATDYDSTTGEPHAVLLVTYHGKEYVLENRHEPVQGGDRLDSFNGIYYMNRMGVE